MSLDAVTFAAHVLRLRDSPRLLILGNATEPLTSALAEQVRAAVALELNPLRAGSEAGTSRIAWLLGSQRDLPFRDGSFDAAAELCRSRALTAESDAECGAVLAELARVLQPGARFLCGEADFGRVAGSKAVLSADKRRVDEWRPEARGVMHHTLRLMRPDGSWLRLHERWRYRNFHAVEGLLFRAGFSVLNAYRD